MALAEEIKISIVGEGGQLTKTLGDLEGQLKRFQDALKNTGNIESFARLQRAADATKVRIEALKGIGNSLVPIKKGTVDATNALTNLGRVAQDAPYGFLGIANNLNPLLESFQRLQKESGGTGGALRALGASLAGAGGIGIALSVASSLLVVFGDKLFKTKNAAEEQSSALQKAKEALSKYAEGLDDVSKARLQTNLGAQEELTKLNALYTASQNANIPLAKRKQLVDELQKQYPAYFGNIRDEIILAGGAEAAYNKLTASILASSRARAAMKQLDDVSGQVFTSEAKSIQDVKELAAIHGKIVALKNSGKKLTEISATGEERLTAVGAQMNRLQDEYNKKNKDVNKTIEERTGLLQRQNTLVNLVNDNSQANPETLLTKDPTAKTAKGQRPQFNFFDKFFDVNPKTASDKAKQAVEMYKTATEFAIKNQDSIEGLDELIKIKDKGAVIEKAKKIWADIQAGLIKMKPPVINLEQEIKLIPKVNDFDFQAAMRSQFLNQQGGAGEGKTTLPIKAEIDFGDFTADYQKKFKALGKNLNVSEFLRPKDDIPKLYEELNSQLTFAAQLVSNTLAPAFQNMFSAIMAGEDPLKSFFQTLGQQVQQLISQLIAAAIKALVLSAITGGGTFFGTAFGKILGVNIPTHMATGGIVPKGFNNDTFPAMLSSGEAVIPLHQLSNLVGNMGSGSPQVIVMQQRLRGRDMILQQARETKAQRRGG